MASASLKNQGLSRRSLLFGGFFAWQHQQEVVLLAGVELRIFANGPSSRRYLRIHGNEETAREALEAHLSSHPGSACIVTSKSRSVELAGGRIDPNRMFSRQGAARSFKAQNPSWSEQDVTRALDWLDAERPKLLDALLPPKGGVLIAVHNNGSGYSVETEAPISQAVSLPRRGEPHEFFLATDPADYKIIAAGPYNVVLQSDAAGEDDGSLSRLCAQRRIRYVNLEVAHGKLDVQKQMLGWLVQSLP